MLPYLKHDQILNLINNGEKLIIANNIIYNITNYYSKHPGGNCILKKIITIDSRNSSRLIVENCDADYNFHSKYQLKNPSVYFPKTKWPILVNFLCRLCS